MNRDRDSEIDLKYRPRSQIPPSSLITGIEFQMATLRTDGLGSDNWPITWANDDHQYTSFGDGVGFGATDIEEQWGPDRVGFGFGRVEGGRRDYLTANVSGGKDPENASDPLFASSGAGNRNGNGKCYGLIGIDEDIYAWRIGDHHPQHMEFSELYKSADHCASWQFTGVRFSRDQFPNRLGFFAPTFCQFGRGYDGARDDYVYVYAPEICRDEGWEVQLPGHVCLMRVPCQDIEDRGRYEFYGGPDRSGNPVWHTGLARRVPVFQDPEKGVMRISVSYNAGLGRYLLIAQQVSRWEIRNGHLGIYEAPEPWGPWSTVLCKRPWDIGDERKLHRGYKTVFWNFSNKWLSADGRGFVLVYTGPEHDEWGTVEGRFVLGDEGGPEA
jgi:hypothetical protein